jgi:hypothetical protein
MPRKLRWCASSLLVLLLACGEARSPGARDDDGEGAQGGGGAGGSGAGDPVGGSGGGSGGEGASGSGGAGGDDGGGPSPPAGSTPCGDGTFTQADALSTCSSKIIGPTGAEYEQHCDAVSIAGGRWEAWCSPTGAYVWTAFDGMQATGSYSLCPGSTSMFLNLAYFEAAVAGQGKGGDLITAATYTIDTAPAADVEIELTIDDADYAAEGSATIWLTPHLEVACPGGLSGPRFSASGVALEWDVTP